MALPVSFVSVTLADNTVKESNGEPETASFEIPVTTLTAANYVAKRGLIDALIADLVGMTIGNPVKLAVTIDREDTGSGPAGSTLAQRENKYLMRYHDAVTKQKFRVSIPVADLTLLPNHSEFLDLTVGTLKADFEAIVVSPDNAANGVVLDSVQFVGRNT